MTISRAKRLLLRSAIGLFCLLIQLPAQAAADITMNMRDADIRTVIQWLSETTGRHFVVDPQVRGNITVVSNEALDPDQAFAVFLQALQLSGFSASVKGKTVTVVPDAKAAQENAIVLDSFIGRSESQRAVHVFRTNSVNAEAIVKQLQPLVSKHGTLTSLAETNAIVIADRVDNIKRVKALINRLDQRGKIDLDVIRLKHIEADAASKSLQQLLSSSKEQQNVGIAADSRSNSILVSGSKEQRAQLRTAVQRIDRPAEQPSNTEVINIQYMQASELLPVLDGVLQANAMGQPGEQFSNVQVSESSNALVVSAPEYLMKKIRDIVASIDVERQQVLLEAIIVEVSDAVINDIGVQWNTDFNGNGVDAATEFGLNQVEQIRNAAGELIEQNSILGNGFTLGYYKQGNLRALLNALSQSADANLLSTPSIVALDNEQAEILVGSNVPLVTGQQTSGANPTTDPFTTLERHDIGVSLQVTPKINQRGSITLDVTQKVESISNVDIARDLVLDKRSIKTRVLVEDDEILVLGGLTRQDNRVVVDRVPVLGYIPILGKLFQRSSDEVVHNNLMVFIHPRILDKKSERKALTQKQHKRMQELQRSDQQTRLKTSPLLEDLDVDQHISVSD